MPCSPVEYQAFGVDIFSSIPALWMFLLPPDTASEVSTSSFSIPLHKTTNPRADCTLLSTPEIYVSSLATRNAAASPLTH